MYVDTHCHLHDAKFEDVGAVVEEYLKCGVSTVIDMGCCAETSKIGMDLAERYPSIFFATGCHPSDSDGFDDLERQSITDLADHPKCVAIGEIGLDYYWEPYDKEKQIKCFLDQLDIAKNKKLPVSIHSRNATEDMVKILKSNKDKIVYGGVLHCFSGSVETAREILNAGLYISFAGPLTFKNANKLLEVAKFVPENKCLTETDSPYLAPHPLRGTLNTPKNVPIITAFLASIKGKDTLEFAKIIRTNAENIFTKLKNV